ncbi:PiggyBac transposable element-derived protein 4 [Plakobranchus ocellatus]|uniref:PiggyBac transposable element-derived protein 4 n=1 Tax=Plakobranchus ocellatus TaxID=259542 RepID=A0AAV3YXM7_9GAST|nr:PiggyBac transposable element-derived protein 4 [Plakobranchus ocellatus]
MTSGGKARPGPSRNLFGSVQVNVMLLKIKLIMTELLNFTTKTPAEEGKKLTNLLQSAKFFYLHLANIQKYFVPGSSLTVDEKLTPFKGRCSFIQYIPSKPAKYGLKLFWVCDSETHYSLKCIIYTGARVLGKSQGYAVVMELTLLYQNKGRNVTMDNFFYDDNLADNSSREKLPLLALCARNNEFQETEAQ